jgi:hypothetical protein
MLFILAKRVVLQGFFLLKKAKKRFYTEGTLFLIKNITKKKALYFFGMEIVF